MRIADISPRPNWVLSIVADDGRIGNFDVSPYLEYEAFEALQDHAEFLKVFNNPDFDRIETLRQSQQAGACTSGVIWSALMARDTGGR